MVIGGFVLTLIFYLIGYLLIQRRGWVLLGLFFGVLAGLPLMGMTIGPTLLLHSANAVNATYNAVQTFIHGL